MTLAYAIYSPEIGRTSQAMQEMNPSHKRPLSELGPGGGHPIQRYPFHLKGENSARKRIDRAAPVVYGCACHGRQQEL